MKKTLLLAAFVATFGVVTGQKSVDIAPFSEVNTHIDLDKNLHNVRLSVLDMEAIHAEDTDGKDGTLWRIAINRQVNLSMENSGTWTDVPGGKVWRLKITSPDALALAMLYDEFYIPENAILHIYNSDRTETIGAFTNENNQDGGVFSTGIVHGESSILEYFEPNEVAGQGKLTITRVSHCYRGIEPLVQDNRGSDPCEVDVRCPEGANWHPQIYSVVRIFVVDGASGGWCTGAVMNNTNQDCSPYILTAEHCGQTSSTSDFNQWIFYFRRQRTSCGSGAVESTASISGCTKRSACTCGGGNSGSDYLLVELNSSIPSNYLAYYAGWDNQNVAGQSGVSVHHPSGDNKKISTYCNQLQTSGWGISNTHWRVNWCSTVTNHGVTEGGSSGSPIFNENGHHVGQLTGGSSYCTSPNAPDYYGKMSYNWNHSTPFGGSLESWLDPAGTGAATLDGIFSPCSTDPTNVQEIILQERTKIYPNPTDGQFTVELINTQAMDELIITVYNAIGEEVQQVDMSGNYLTRIDLTGMANGMYYINMRSGNTMVTKKLSLVR